MTLTTRSTKPQNVGTLTAVPQQYPAMYWRGVAVDALLAIGVVALVSVIVGAIESVNHVSNISNLYVIGIAILASRRGPYPAVFASVLAFLAYDWLFTPPLHEFTAADPSEYVALLTLLVTAIIIGQLLAVARRQTNEARTAQRHTQLVYEVSQAALSAPDILTVYPMALWRLNDALGLTGSRLFLIETEGAQLVQAASSGALGFSAEEHGWLEQVVREQRGLVVWEQSRNNVRITVQLDLAAPDMTAPEGARLREILLPLRVESVVHGVVVVGAKRDGSPMHPEDHQLLVAFASQLAVAVDRQDRAEQQARARALEESDRLKTALVSSVSHELKTPLAAIKASVTTLLGEHPEPQAQLRRELAESINRETDRLTRLVSNLLDMSRLEAGALRPQLEWASIADVVADVLDRMEPITHDRDVDVEIPDDIPLVRMDFVQISQVLTNLLDNAVRYSQPGTSIRVAVSLAREQLRVTVFNEGEPLPDDELDKLFEKFYRLSPASGGIGLGLSIVRGIVEAHGGRVWAENVGRRGVAVTFTLP